MKGWERPMFFKNKQCT